MNIFKFIREIDIFGVSIQINLKGKYKSGTLFGGLDTIFCMMGLLAFFGTLVNKIVQHLPTVKN